MNRTLKEATVQRYHYDSHDQLRRIQHSQESVRTLASRYGINAKTVAKWKARASMWGETLEGFEPRCLVALRLRQAGDAVALQAAVQGRSRQMRDGRLQSVKAVVPAVAGCASGMQRR
jgi:hypothetical protein